MKSVAECMKRQKNFVVINKPNSPLPKLKAATKASCRASCKAARKGRQSWKLIAMGISNETIMKATGFSKAQLNAIQN